MSKAPISTTKAAMISPAARWALVLMLAVLAFFATYRYAIASGSPAAGTPPTAAASAPGAVAQVPGTAAQAPAAGAKAAGSGCGCCGGTPAPAGAVKSKPADVSGDVQKITVDASKGYYEPSTIELKAGVPAEITFSQASGCLQQVESADLGFSEDLSSGPKTIKLGALTAGAYGFNCGMQMQFGTIVVK
jgi:plastocyanin